MKTYFLNLSFLFVTCLSLSSGTFAQDTIREQKLRLESHVRIGVGMGDNKAAGYAHAIVSLTGRNAQLGIGIGLESASKTIKLKKIIPTDSTVSYNYVPIFVHYEFNLVNEKKNRVYALVEGGGLFGHNVQTSNAATGNLFNFGLGWKHTQKDTGSAIEAGYKKIIIGNGFNMEYLFINLGCIF